MTIDQFGNLNSASNLIAAYEVTVGANGNAGTLNVKNSGGTTTASIAGADGFASFANGAITIGANTGTAIWLDDDGTALFGSVTTDSLNATNSVDVATGAITLGTNTGTAAWIHSNGSASFGSGSCTIDQYGYASFASGTFTATTSLLLGTAGTGLSGGGTSGDVTLSIASAQSDLVIKGFEEDVNVVASAATGTINFDVATASVWYYTSNATANHTLNFRYDGSNTLSSKLAVGDAITLVWLNTNGSTAYYPNVIQIDGSAVTPKVPAAISAGNASAIDAYVFTIIKTAATPTYTVLETQTKFA